MASLALSSCGLAVGGVLQSGDQKLTDSVEADLSRGLASDLEERANQFTAVAAAEPRGAITPDDLKFVSENVFITEKQRLRMWDPGVMEVTGAIYDLKAAEEAVTIHLYIYGSVNSQQGLTSVSRAAHGCTALTWVYESETTEMSDIACPEWILQPPSEDPPPESDINANPEVSLIELAASQLGHTSWTPVEWRIDHWRAIRNRYGE